MIELLICTHLWMELHVCSWLETHYQSCSYVVLECFSHLSLLRLVLLLQARVFITYWARLMLIWRIISVINLKNLGLCLWKVDPELWGNYPNWVEWVRTGLAHPSVHCATIGSLVPALGAFHFHNHPCAVSGGPWALPRKHLSLKK